MLGSAYFESNPWDRALELITSETLGDIVEVQVQAVCGSGSLGALVSRWKERIESAIGPAAIWDELNGPGMVSVIGRAGGAVVRLFVDESGPVSENFELVLENGLLVWNNALRPISLIYTDERDGVILSDLGPVVLGREL